VTSYMGFKSKRIFGRQFVEYLTISMAFTDYDLKRRGWPLTCCCIPTGASAEQCRG
jgi:hypothetical protein